MWPFRHPAVFRPDVAAADSGRLERKTAAMNVSDLPMPAGHYDYDGTSHGGARA